MVESRKLITIAVLISLTGGSWWLAHYFSAPTVKVTPPADEPDYTIDNFVTRAFNEKGEIKYILRASHLKHYPAEDISTLELPYLVQYQPQQQPLHVRAKQATLRDNNSILLMEGDVRIARGADPRKQGGDILTPRFRVILDKTKKKTQRKKANEQS
jgi:lipopolysaccharide export system protein LptC